jgi:hypothetical protein
MNAPEVTRTEPDGVLGEREMLDGWLDYHRATLLAKCAGLDSGQLTTVSCPPSPLSLLGLVRHLTDVENGWFWPYSSPARQPRYSTDEDEDADFTDLDSVPVAEVFAAYQAECERSRTAVAGYPLDHTRTGSRGQTYTLRWVYLHMIEEYARHNGHADLIRERIDGATGE